MDPFQWRHLMFLVPLALAVLPILGYGRTQRLQGFVRDPRLTALGWFFLLYGIAAIVQSGGMVVSWQGPAPQPFGDGNGTFQMPAGSEPATFGPGPAQGEFHVLRFDGNGTQNGTRPFSPADRFIVAAEPAWPFWIHHGLVVAALGIVAFAYLRPNVGTDGSGAAGMLAAVPFFLVGNAMLQSVEALLALVPTVMSVVNWRQRRTRGSLQVAIGFGLIAAAHLAFVSMALLRPPVLVPFFDILALAGIATLVFAVPRGP